MADIDFEKPSAIQQRAILPITQGRDVIAQAQSGTGKTATFSISILQSIDVTVRETQVTCWSCYSLGSRFIVILITFLSVERRSEMISESSDFPCCSNCMSNKMVMKRTNVTAWIEYVARQCDLPGVYIKLHRACNWDGRACQNVPKVRILLVTIMSHASKSLQNPS